MVVPEQRHLLDQRLVGGEHLLDPPGAQLAAMFAHLLLHDLRGLGLNAVLGGLCSRLLAQEGRTFVDPCRARSQSLRMGLGKQAIDRGWIVERGQGLDLGRRCAEGSARKQMPRIVEAHRLGGARETRQPQRGGERCRPAHETTSTETSDHDDAPTVADALAAARLRPTADCRSGRPGSCAACRAARASTSMPSRRWSACSASAPRYGGG